MSHIMENEHADGKRWRECVNCGASFHSKLWWLGGYKSEKEPKCLPYSTDTEWKNTASHIYEDSK